MKRKARALIGLVKAKMRGEMASWSGDKAKSCNALELTRNVWAKHSLELTWQRPVVCWICTVKALSS